MTIVREEELQSALDSDQGTLEVGTALADYGIAYRSRQASLIGRREVMSGKAKFGIFGDGKEVPQVAMAQSWQPGDFRSGYYRDQTLLLALGMTSIAEFFAQLYAHPDVEAEPMTGGRQMNAHFASRSLEDDGSWKTLTAMYNSSADVSPTGSQMPRLVGLAYASKLYRDLDALEGYERFSHQGNEVAWGTIGNATCAEGMFWEAINAVGVLGGPMVLSIWDDEYGISVPNRYQIAGGDLSALLAGFQRIDQRAGFELRTVPGWDYQALVDVYAEAAATARRDHVPTIVHVTELTQPQGHSTSGSHERYKSPERLEWEAEWDGLVQMRRWLVASRAVADDALRRLEGQWRGEVEKTREDAWAAFVAPMEAERQAVTAAIDAIAGAGPNAAELNAIRQELGASDVPIRENIMIAAQKALVAARSDQGPAVRQLQEWRREQLDINRRRYGSHLYAEGSDSALAVAPVAAEYATDAPLVPGYDVLNACFDAMLAGDPRVVAFGEDLGKIGDVNQGFRGLQDKYGSVRVADTGIRECTIIGQAIGLAMRGLRPIAEIQYLDYLLYALQIMSDDLATLRWRSHGGQKAPVIVRTRGHRLEGIWHAGSPMAGIISLVRGMHMAVPRNMTQAAGFYNTLLAAEEPGLVVEVLNGYRLRERLPANIGQFRLPLGVPEVLRPGDDVTVVTYGACCRIALAAGERLAEVGVETEVIDVQTLLPFDRTAVIGRSLAKTGRVLFLDEDVPGGATAYMMREVIEAQDGYKWLDSEPRTLSARAHRPAYGSDGDYFSKPNAEDVFEAVYEIMNEADPRTYPQFL